MPSKVSVQQIPQQAIVSLVILSVIQLGGEADRRQEVAAR